MKFKKNKNYYLLNKRNEIEDINFIEYRDMEIGWDTYHKTPVFQKAIKNGLNIEILDNNEHGEIFDDIDHACLKRDFNFELKNELRKQKERFDEELGDAFRTLDLKIDEVTRPKRDWKSEYLLEGHDGEPIGKFLGVDFAQAGKDHTVICEGELNKKGEMVIKNIINNAEKNIDLRDNYFEEKREKNIAIGMFIVMFLIFVGYNIIHYFG